MVNYGFYYNTKNDEFSINKFIYFLKLNKFSYFCNKFGILTFLMKKDMIYSMKFCKHHFAKTTKYFMNTTQILIMIFFLFL